MKTQPINQKEYGRPLIRTIQLRNQKIMHKSSNKIKKIAFYLPQFHEFEVNNLFWGKGFTEWTCLKNTKEKTHQKQIIRRPHKDIGEYCLESSDVRKKQGEMAKKYGLYGFCYYHYWFNELVLMDKPLQLMLKDGYPDLPFCFSWANESWTKQMNGGSGEVIVPSVCGGEKEWRGHLNYLLNFFHHKNYITIDNKPILVIYRPSKIKNFEKRIEFWRKEIQKNGFDDLFLVATLGNFLNDDWNHILKHFDAAVESFPNFFGNDNICYEKTKNTNYYKMESVTDYICDFKKIHPIRQIPGVLTGFNSYPRNKKICNTILGSTPELFEKLLKKKMSISSDEFMFINAWNEWGEGATLEPDEIYGYGFLESLEKCTKFKWFL